MEGDSEEEERQNLLPTPPPYLFERLAQLQGYTWETHLQPFHSTYDNWHVLGHRHLQTEPSTASSHDTGTSKTNSTKSSPRLGPHRPSLRQHETSRFGEPKNAGNESGSITSKSDWNGEAKASIPVIARVSTHALRIEREYYLCKSFMQTSDPDCKHVARLLDLVRLPSRSGDASPLTASIFESPGRNALRDLLDFGPAWHGPPLWYKNNESASNLLTDEDGQPRVSLALFFGFAIGASECLELLHHGIRVVHGELRADAFHYNRDTGLVKLVNFGSGPRSFENGLTSSGWLALSQELGVKHKLQYIAPEQTGRMPAEPDSRTDIYSLGVIFWTMLTGRPAYEGETPIDVVQAVLGKRLPSVGSLRMDVPDAISNVIHKMTHKQIDERYHSTSGLKHDLIEIQRMLGEGDTEGLQNYVVGTKDVSSFFVLPAQVFGREKEHAIIIDAAKSLAKAQQLLLENALHGLNSFESTSASTISDRLEQLELGTRSSDRSSISSQLGRISPPGSPKMESRRPPKTQMQDANNGSDADSSLQPKPSKEKNETTPTIDTARSNQRNEYTSGKRPGSGNGPYKRKHLTSRRRRRCEVITIVGSAGLGKSTLIQSAQAEIRAMGYFTTAKFDANMKAPFEPLLHAMGSLLRQIFSDSDLETPYHNSVRENLQGIWPSVSVMLNLPENLLRTESTEKKTKLSGVLNVPHKSLQSELTDSSSMQSTQSGAAFMSTSEFAHGGTNPRSMKFISIFTEVVRILSTNKLICLCLDGLHLADPESLELVSNLIKKKLGILILATCRDDRQHLSPPINKIMHNDSANNTLLQLAPLSETEVVHYVAATLQREAEYVLPLSLVCLEKTSGNPFYLRQVLELCHRKGYLWYSWKQSAWEYDLDRVFTEFSTEHADQQQLNSSFITRRLQKDLPPAARAVLAWASLLGSTFSFAMVRKLLSGEFDDALDDVDSRESRCPNAVDILSPQNTENVVEGLQSTLQSYILMPGANEDEFCFSHDRYIQASASLLECQNIERMHFIIVQTLIKYPELDGRPIYARAQHICAAASLIKRRVRNRKPYRSFLRGAAKVAIDSGARSSALQYYEIMLDLLPKEPWVDSTEEDATYDETLAIYTEAAELFWHQERFDGARKTLNAIFENARSAAHRAPAWIFQSKLFAQSGDMSGACTALKTSLVELGQKFDAESTWERCDEDLTMLDQILEKETFEKVFAKPLSTDTDITATGSVILEAISSAFWTNPLLYYQMCLKMMETHLRCSGTFPQIGLGCMYFAMICTIRRPDLSLAVRMHTKAMDLSRQYEDSYTMGRTLGISGLFIAHLLSPLRGHATILEEAIDHSLISGDKHLFLLSIGGVAMSKIFTGDDMSELESYCAVAPEDFAGDWTRDVRGGTFLIASRQVARALQGKTWTESAGRVMSDDSHATPEYLSWLFSKASNANFPLTVYKSMMLVPLFLYGHYDKAIEVSEELFPNLGSLWSLRNTRLVFFFAALSIVAKVRQDPENPARDTLLATVEQYNEQIVAWQAQCDTNYRMWSCLIEAELNELKQHYHVSIQHYETAIDHCQLYDFNLELALAFELQAEFFIRRGAKRAARATILDSLASWSRMNAKGKVDQLSGKHEWILHSVTTVRSRDVGCQTASSIGDIGNTQSRLEENERQETKNLGPQTAGDRTNAWLSPIPQPIENSKPLAPAGGHPNVSEFGLDILDLQSILEFNQAISSELQIDRLLAKMTGIILESAGAQADFAGVVIENEQGWCIAASGTADGISADALPITEIGDVTQKQVLLYTMRFKEVVFVHDLALDDRFSKTQSHKSALSLPILQGTNLLGVLYLQGQPHSFTNRSLGVLQLFCSQVSISIANALLFRKIAKVSAANASMIESQKLALAAAREAEIKAKAAEAEAMENVRLKEEAAKAKSMFLANVSHELRTPLNGVIGMSELLKGSPLSKEQEGYADSIRVCADTLLTVINDILDFSKLEAGKMKLLRVPLNLKDTITEVVRALSYTNVERGLETHAELDLDPEQLVMGDPVRIHQIFMNLLSNSYKFTAKGSVTVKAKRDYEDAYHVRVTCSVADTGIGITQEQATRLFKPFSQADSSTQRSYGGSGLGLSICKALVAVLDGKIWLESQLGHGTTVFFTLNFPKSTSKPALNTNGVISPKPDIMATWSSDESHAGYHDTAPGFDLSKIPREKLRICIAEDNPINQKIAVSFVNKLGFKCEAYSDGLQAVEALRDASAKQNPFHLCLMDVQMPVLDGYDATRLIRKDDDTAVRTIVVVAMTASAIRGDREKCLQAGMNNYLAKPVRIDVLKKMLNEILSHPTKSVSTEQQSPMETKNQATEGGSNSKGAAAAASDHEKSENTTSTTPSFTMRMNSRNDIHDLDNAGEATPKLKGQGKGEDLASRLSRPIFPSNGGSKVKSDDTITPATSSATDGARKTVQIGNLDGAVPALDLANDASNHEASSGGAENNV